MADRRPHTFRSMGAHPPLRHPHGDAHPSAPLRMPFAPHSIPIRTSKRTPQAPPEYLPPSSSAPHAPFPSHIPIYNKVLGPFLLVPVGVVSSAITAKKGAFASVSFLYPRDPTFVTPLFPQCHPTLSLHLSPHPRKTTRKRLRTTASSPTIKGKKGEPSSSLNPSFHYPHRLPSKHHSNAIKRPF